MMTAKEFCAGRRSPAFGAYRVNGSQWRKAGRGLIAVVDRETKVIPGLLFGVEIHDGIPSLYSYRRIGADGTPWARPTTLNCVRTQLQTWPHWSAEKITWDEMIQMVKDVYPDAYVPEKSQFWLMYGFLYNRRTGEIENYIGLEDD